MIFQGGFAGTHARNRVYRRANVSQALCLKYSAPAPASHGGASTGRCSVPPLSPQPAELCPQAAPCPAASLAQSTFEINPLN